MFCISLPFELADTAIREQFPHGADMLEYVDEGVFLSTCNRIELYGNGDLYAVVNRFFGAYKTRIFIYEGQLAVRHLYLVAAGLNSMVLGEDEILGQVKKAFLEAQEAGHTGYELNTIFKGAITAAKRVKTDTLLSKSSVSIATLAAAACKQCHDDSGRTRSKVLVIGGSGDTGAKVIKDLLSMDRFDISATVREHGIRNHVQEVDYCNRYDVLKEADIIISATKSPHFTVTAEEVKNAGGKSPTLYIDLAVPRDIDPALSPVLTIDDFENKAQHNNEVKREAAQKAEDILEEELDVLWKDLTFHELVPLLDSIPDRQQLYDFREAATAEEFRRYADVLLRLYQKKEEPTE